MIRLQAQHLLRSLTRGLVGDASRCAHEIENVARAVLLSTERMDQMIASALQDAEMESERISMEIAPVDLASVAAESVDLLAPLGAKSGVTVACVAGPATIDGDELRIHEALDNLITNAIKFTPRGGRVEVLVSSKGSRAELTVRDTGDGMCADDMRHIFERCWRSKGEKGGCGLGLYLVRRIVEAHGGAIAVESSPGRGSTFRLTFPLAPDEGGASV